MFEARPLLGHATGAPVTSSLAVDWPRCQGLGEHWTPSAARATSPHPHALDDERHECMPGC